MADHIQIGDITPRKHYTADGTQTTFTFPFPIFKDADLEVYLDDDLQASGYSVTGAGEDLGGEVIFTTAPALGVAVTLRRRLSIARQSDFQESGSFRARVINDELDFLVAALQQVADDARRSVQLSATDPDAALALPDKETRSNTFLAFDADGRPVAGTGSVDGLPVSTFAATLLDDIDANAARTTLSAQADLGLATPAVADAGSVLSVSPEGDVHYDPTLSHGAHLTALSHGL